MTEQMLRAVIYTRVSTDEQVTNFSLDSQEDECRKYASRQGYQIIQVFREEGASAKTVEGRPILLELLQFCRQKKNQVDKVLVYKLDRWSRDTEKGLQITALLATFKVELISVTEPTGNTAMGKAMRNMILVMAELDNGLKSERTLSGMKAAFEQGHWPWKAPMGYMHTIVGNKKAMIQNPGYVEVIKPLFDEAATGLYIRKELAERMNDRGFGRLYGTKATDKTVDKITTKRIYYGLMEAPAWQKQAMGNHAPMI